MMRVITHEELEKGRINPIPGNQVYCRYKGCKERGQFQMCGLDSYIFCPIFDEYYKSLSERQREKMFGLNYVDRLDPDDPVGRLEDLDQAGGFQNWHGAGT